MAKPYETMSEAANARPMPMKAMEVPDPEERLHDIVADLTRAAEALEVEARDLEDRMLLCRARAAGLRTAVGGVESAIEKFMQEMGKRQEFMAHRDGEDVPEMKYDARAHANRIP